MTRDGLMHWPILVALILASLLHAALIFGFRFNPPRSGQHGRPRLTMTLVQPAPRAEPASTAPVMAPPTQVSEPPELPTVRPKPPPTPAPPAATQPVAREPGPVKTLPSPPALVGPPRPALAEVLVGPPRPAVPPWMVGPPAPSARELEKARQGLAARRPAPVETPQAESPPSKPMTAGTDAGAPGSTPVMPVPARPRPIEPSAPTKPEAEDEGAAEDEEGRMAEADDEESETNRPTETPPKAPVSAKSPDARGGGPTPAASSRPPGSPEALLPQPRQTAPVRPTEPRTPATARVSPRIRAVAVPPAPLASSPIPAMAGPAKPSPVAPVSPAPPAQPPGQAAARSSRQAESPSGRTPPGRTGKIGPGISAGLLSQQIAEVSEDIYMSRSVALLGARIVYARDMKSHRLVLAAYEQAWQEKVERHGNRNFPDEARRRKLSGSLVLAVGIQPDGRVYSVQVLQSSGHEALDNAARHIVDLAAPFAPLPREIRQDVDVLVITRTWRFDSDFKLETRGR